MECSVLNPRLLWKKQWHHIYPNVPVLGDIPTVLHFSNPSQKPLQMEVLPLFRIKGISFLPFNVKLFLKWFTHVNHSAAL